MRSSFTSDVKTAPFGEFSLSLPKYATFIYGGYTRRASFKRRLRTRLQLAILDHVTDMRDKQEWEEKIDRELDPGDKVWVYDCCNKHRTRWERGRVMQRLGPVAYMVQIREGIRHVHIDHLRKDNSFDINVMPEDLQVFEDSALSDNRHRYGSKELLVTPPRLMERRISQQGHSVIDTEERETERADESREGLHGVPTLEPQSRREQPPQESLQDLYDGPEQPLHELSQDVHGRLEPPSVPAEPRYPRREHRKPLRYRDE